VKQYLVKAKLVVRDEAGVGSFVPAQETGKVGWVRS